MASLEHLERPEGSNPSLTCQRWAMIAVRPLLASCPREGEEMYSPKRLRRKRGGYEGKG